MQREEEGKEGRSREGRIGERQGEGRTKREGRTGLKRGKEREGEWKGRAADRAQRELQIEEGERESGFEKERTK